MVGGDQESRKGIVLTKSPPAKKFKIKTGSSITEALSLCPHLIVIPANYPLYLHFSQRMREIVLEHTDTIKPFGSDEMWCQLYGDRAAVMKTVQDIRQAIWRQLCLTVSIGVGDNLPYAKLGSDLAPNSGVCEMWNEEKEKRVYPLPVGDLLYCGPATTEKLNKNFIHTIGDLAKSDPDRICRILHNKTGEYLWTMATGQDRTTVAHIESVEDTQAKMVTDTYSHIIDQNRKTMAQKFDAAVYGNGSQENSDKTLEQLLALCAEDPAAMNKLRSIFAPA